MKSRTIKVLGSAALAVAGIALVPAVATAGPKAPAKTAICHYDKEMTTWYPISVSSKSVASHMKHGDGLPGGAVPGQDGYVFDSSCVPTPI